MRRPRRGGRALSRPARRLVSDVRRGRAARRGRAQVERRASNSPPLPTTSRRRLTPSNTRYSLSRSERGAQGTSGLADPRRRSRRSPLTATRSSQELKARSAARSTFRRGRLPGAAPARAKRPARKRLVERDRAAGAASTGSRAAAATKLESAQARVARLLARRRRGARMSYLDDLSRRARGARDPRRDARSHPREVDDHLRSEPDARGAFRLAGRDCERVRGRARVAGVAAGRLRRLRGARRRRRGVRRRVRLAGVREPADRDARRPRSARSRSRRWSSHRRWRSSAGALALVRALRRRGRAMPTAELRVLRRRTSVALASGVVTMGALALYGLRVRAVARRLVDDGRPTSPRRAAALLLLAASVPAAPRGALQAGARRLRGRRLRRSRPRAAATRGDSPARSRSPSERRSGSPASSRAIRSTASSAGSSKRPPASPASRRSGGTSASVASIGAWPSRRPSATSPT